MLKRRTRNSLFASLREKDKWNVIKPEKTQALNIYAGILFWPTDWPYTSIFDAVTIHIALLLLLCFSLFHSSIGQQWMHILWAQELTIEYFIHLIAGISLSLSLPISHSHALQYPPNMPWMQVNQWTWHCSQCVFYRFAKPYQWLYSICSTQLDWYTHRAIYDIRVELNHTKWGDRSIDQWYEIAMPYPMR